MVICRSERMVITFGADPIRGKCAEPAIQDSRKPAASVTNCYTGGIARGSWGVDS